MRDSAAVATAQQDIGCIAISAALVAKNPLSVALRSRMYSATVPINSNNHRRQIEKPTRLLLFARFCTYLVAE
jgi:hypothetical protein